MARRRLLVTREDVAKIRPGANWISDHMFTAAAIPLGIASVAIFPVMVYAPGWFSMWYLIALVAAMISAVFWFLRSM